jgi:hypothetical protein
LRSNIGIRSARMSIRAQMAWYWRWLLNILMMVVVAAVVWWLVENSNRITGYSQEEARQRLATLTDENRVLRRDLEVARGALNERDRQLEIDRASQGELARNVAQLQEENAALKEDLGFLRNIMSSGATPEGLGVSNLKIEPDGKPNQFRYRMLLTQGGQLNTFTFPDAAAGEADGVDFRFYRKVEGRFALPEDAVLRSVEVRVLAMPGGQVKLSRTLNFP